jgi:hypothetical protein
MDRNMLQQRPARTKHHITLGAKHLYDTCTGTTFLPNALRYPASR